MSRLLSNPDQIHVWTSAATFMDELVQCARMAKNCRCQDGMELRFAFMGSMGQTRLRKRSNLGHYDFISLRSK